MHSYQYFMPTEVIYAPGALTSLAKRCQVLGTRPLIVTGRQSARATGLLDRILAQLPSAQVFDQVEENPTIATCMRGAKCCLDTGCDYVIGVGGGSPMDAAKAVAMLATNPGPCAEYFGVDKFPNAPLPVAAIPTTAGTGSEVTPYAVIVDEVLRSKKTISGRMLFPVFALLDPELSVTMPPAVTVATGLDALSQAMEGMLSKRSTAVGDALALETCRLVKEWLPRAVADPANLEARGRMLHAAMLSGCIIAQSGTTLVHGMGYYFTLEFGLAHGLANALLLTPVFQFNAHLAPEKVAPLAAALGFDTGNPVRDIGKAVHALMREVGISPKGQDFGVRLDRMEQFAEDIYRDTGRFKNQIGAFTVDDVYRLFVAACTGDLEEYAAKRSK